MSGRRNLKAFVRYDGSGRVIPGGPIASAVKPKVGNWKEIPNDQCCSQLCKKALFLTRSGNLYLYNFEDNTYKKLTLPNFPSLPVGGIGYYNIVHNSKKLWVSVISNVPSFSTTFHEWDIKLPYLYAKYVRSYTPLSGIYIGATASQESTSKLYVMLSSASPQGLYELDFSSGSIVSTLKFSIATPGGVSNGTDLLQTTNGKFLITLSNSATGDLLRQYSNTGVLEVSVPLPPNPTNLQYWSIVEANSEIYIAAVIADNLTGPSNIYKVDSFPPYALTEVDSIPSTELGGNIISGSQIPTCCVTDLTII
jgi:hypothetical protein